MKKCAFCGELIADETIVCPWCGRRDRNAKPASNSDAQRTPRAANAQSQTSRATGIVVLLLAVLVGVVYLIVARPISTSTARVSPTALTTLTPTSPPIAFFRPSTRLVLDERRLRGQGKLQIQNGLKYDGVVILALAETPKPTLLAAYIRAGESYTITGIPDGEYVVMFASGADWSGEKFNRDVQRQRFQDTFPFITTTDGDVKESDVWSITLQPVPDGNATVVPVDEADFPRISPDVLDEEP